MTDDLLLRRAVVSASAIVYWGGVLVQARRVRRHIGRSPNLKPRGSKERFLWVGWLSVILLWIVQPLLLRPPPRQSEILTETFNFRLWPFDLGLWTLDFGLSNFALVTGLALVAAGYAGTLWCYSAMGDSWRIGVNRTEKNVLITAGPYRCIRHPIYLFQVVMLAGAAFLLPTALSAGILLFHLVCVWIKATDEEAYLSTAHGRTYQDYLARTGRLLPKFSGGLRTESK